MCPIDWTPVHDTHPDATEEDLSDAALMILLFLAVCLLFGIVLYSCLVAVR